MNNYLKLALEGLIPAALTALFCVLERYTPFKKLPYWLRQGVIGVFFGGAAILCTEWGIFINGATLNCRDAAPLCAGLFFGGPAGILAGLIGGVERWFAVYWGAGSFTRWACAIGTLTSGLSAAWLRKNLFDDSRPSRFLSVCTGAVVEVFHLTLVFVTNVHETARAAAVVKTCTLPMVLTVAGSTALASQLYKWVAREKSHREAGGREHIHITAKIQRKLLAVVLTAFVISSGFVALLQYSLVQSQVASNLTYSLQDLSADITDAGNEKLLTICREAAAEIGEATPQELCRRYSVAEVNVVDENGVITASSNPEFVGFDMNSGEQSAEFLCLLRGKETYVQPLRAISYDETLKRKYAGVALPEGGFVQVAYDADTFMASLQDVVAGDVTNRRVGENGYILVLDYRQEFVNCTDGTPEDLLEDIPAQLQAHDKETSRTLFRVDTAGVKYYARFIVTEGYTLIGMLPMEEANRNRDVAMYVNTFLEVLIFAVMFAVMFFIINKHVVSPIRRVNRSLAKIAGGDLTEQVSVRTAEEFTQLSGDINSTVDTLKDYIDKAAKRLDEELELAKDIQHSALPSEFPAYPNRGDFDIHAVMYTAKEVGGDFYDFYFNRADSLNFLVADVSGKGVPAAMFMMRAKTQLASLRESNHSLDEVFSIGNDRLCVGNEADMFVTSWMCSVDLTSGKAQFVNAGHNPPLLYRASEGRFDYLRTKPGLVLAAMPEMPYRLEELTLEPGDTLFLYTDGVTEATDADMKLYGEERLLRFLNSRSFSSMKELCEAVKGDVDDFVGDAPQFDDITALAFRYTGLVKKTLSFPEAVMTDILEVTSFAEEALTELGCPRKKILELCVVIDEVFSNIVKFAYDGAAGPAGVMLEEQNEPRGVTLTFSDAGRPYNPLGTDESDPDFSPESRSEEGLGLYLARQLSDGMTYVYQDGQNNLRVKKFF